MANRSTKGGTGGGGATPEAMKRGLARLASFMRIRGEVERATNRAAWLARPLSAHPSRNRWEEVLSSPQTDGEVEKRGLLSGWSKLVKKIDAASPSQHLDFVTGAKNPEARGFTNLLDLVEPLAKLVGTSRDWAAAAISRVGRALASASAAPLEAGGAEVSLMDLTAPQVAIPTSAVVVGERIHHLGIKGSRLEGWLASQLHDERSDVHLRKWEARRGGTNAWHVTHSPQITVVVNGPDSGHPRKIAEQMVMALQSHHSELDQKLADAWKRQAVRDERTGF